MKYGPDGGVFLIDWYDKNACHRHQPEIWDRSSGRIYKITCGTPKPVKVDLGKMEVEELVPLLTHKNDWYARTSRRVLQERWPIPGGSTWLAAVGLSEHLGNKKVSVLQRLRALWALHTNGGAKGDGGLQEELAGELHLLDDPEELIRAWTVQLLLERREASDTLAAKLASMARTDGSAVVRLYLAAALQRLSLDQRWQLAQALLKRGEDVRDHNLPLMHWYGIEPLVLANTPRALKLAQESKIPLVSRFIVRRAAADAKGLEHVLATVGAIEDEGPQLLMLDEVANTLKSRGRVNMPAPWPDVFSTLNKSKNETIRERARFISVKFGDRSVFPVLRSILADAKADATSREQALAALLAGKDEELPAALHKLLDDAAVRGPAIRALGAYDHADTPKALIARYKSLSQSEQQDVVTTLAARQTYAMALLKAIEAGTVPRNDLSAYLVRQVERFESQELKDLLGKVWGTVRTTAADKQKLIAQHKAKLTPEVIATARLSHGRVTYQKTCGSCHKLFGEGGAIGPDLTGSNRANLDYILENMLDPSAVVGRDYQMTVILTAGGRSLSGLIKEENDSAITLQTANEVVVVPKDEIERRQKSELSIMPEGQLQPMTADEIRDLVAYLASPVQVPLLGEVPPIDPKTGRVPGAIEGETLKVLAKTGGNAGPQKMDPFTKDRWSGADQLWWTGAGPGSKLTLGLPVEQGGRYELLAVLTKARDYGIMQFSLDGKPLGGPIDFYNAPDVITSGPLTLGTHDLKAGPHKLTIEIVGANPKAVKAYMCGLDYVYLAKPKEPEKKR
jgi:putative heme-binding domain-containing protein